MTPAGGFCAVLALLLTPASAQEATWIEVYDETSNKL